MQLQTGNVDDFPTLQMVRTGRLIRLLGKLTFIALLLVIFVMIFVPWRQTAPGSGMVVALDPQQRPQAVHSQAKGVVSYVKPGLREGSYVEQGDLLLKMDPFAADGIRQMETQIMATESKKVSAKASLQVAIQLEKLQQTSGERLAESLAQDLEVANQKWEATKNELDSAEADLSDKRNQYRIAERVEIEGIISKEELVSKQYAVESMEAKVRKATNAVSQAKAALESKKEEINSKKEEIKLKNQEAHQKVLMEEQKINEIDKALQELMAKRDEFDRLEITAPRSGYIHQWFGVAGSDTVKEGDQLFVIVPEADELAVEMKVSGNDMPLIHVGDRVRLQFHGWPAVQFVGWPSVAVGTFGGKVNRIFPTDDGKGYFRVVVTADNHFEREDGWPDDRYLRQGVRANGWVLLKRVPLGYEIWRQLNGFPPVVADDEPKPGYMPKVKLPKG